MKKDREQFTWEEVKQILDLANLIAVEKEQKEFCTAEKIIEIAQEANLSLESVTEAIARYHQQEFKPKKFKNKSFSIGDRQIQVITQEDVFLGIIKEIVWDIENQKIISLLIIPTKHNFVFSITKILFPIFELSTSEIVSFEFPDRLIVLERAEERIRQITIGFLEHLELFKAPWEKDWSDSDRENTNESWKSRPNLYFEEDEEDDDSGGLSISPRPKKPNPSFPNIEINPVDLPRYKKPVKAMLKD
ncbi:MAG: hypothetical protein HC820_10155 [Hydrococcus sp. RM1_1_31]|nr:hypothetical protein [Hydrococcus sp. RM1_1_31]